MTHESRTAIIKLTFKSKIKEENIMSNLKLVTTKLWERSLQLLQEYE